MKQDNSAPILADLDIQGGGSSRLFIDGVEFLNFAGCNYLALTHLPELRRAATEALESGCKFSRFVHPDYGGREHSFDRVEKAAARFWDAESAIYLPSGYHLGFAAVAALEPYIDAIVLDQQAHWCLEHAAILSELPIFRFAHCDVDSLNNVLEEMPGQTRPLIMSDGVFATTGRMPPLDKYAELAEAYDGQMLVDESHAAGVLGDTGRGAAQHLGLTSRVHVASTLSKGFCSQGAVFCGTEEMISRANKTPAIRGSNQGSPISAEVAAAALEYVLKNPSICTKLRANTSYLRSELRQLGLEIEETPASIVSFGYGNFETMRAIQRALFEKRMYVLHSNYIAAGPDGVIRLSVYADHSTENLKKVVNAISKLISG
jgi:7-keto-8-aminopelargonate synthetase-like enzyme